MPISFYAMIRVTEPLSTHSRNRRVFDGEVFELNEKCANRFRYVLEALTGNFLGEIVTPVRVADVDKVSWSAVLESAQNVPELVSFCR
jgi:hypothetical protein